MLKAYVAHAITGRTGNELWRESTIAEIVLRRHGIETIDPVVIEGLPRTDEPVPNRPDSDGLEIWRGDEASIRKAHVLIDITPEMKSEGVLWEICYARFLLWKPVIRVYKPGSKPHMATVFKGDVIAFSLDEAARKIDELWGTWWKRAKWRVCMLGRSLPKFLKYQIGEFK
jgi:hypothetical protein